MPIFRILPAIILACLAAATPAHAQSTRFETAISVNGAGISGYEIDQRIRLLRALSVPGDLRRQAEDALVEERLYLQAAASAEIALSSDAVDVGMEEFAARANLNAAQFLARIARFGVSRQSYREFVRAGMLWRELVNIRFGERAALDVSANVDRALAQQAQGTSVEVLLAEIAIPFDEELRDQALAFAQQITDEVKTKERFAEVARSVSAARSRESGGDIDWLPLSELPAGVRNAVDAAPSGSVLAPAVIQGVIYVFFKRGERETTVGPRPFETEFATLAIPESENRPAREAAEEITARVSTCVELQAESSNWADGSFERISAAAGSEPEKLAFALARLDGGEAAVLESGGESGLRTAEIVMLCERKVVRSQEQLNSVLVGLQGSRVEDYARNYLNELRAAAHIRRR